MTHLSLLHCLGIGFCGDVAAGKEFGSVRAFHKPWRALGPSRSDLRDAMVTEHLPLGKRCLHFRSRPVHSFRREPRLSVFHSCLYKETVGCRNDEGIEEALNLAGERMPVRQLLAFANRPDFDGKFCESPLPGCNFIWPPLSLPTRFSCQHKIRLEQLRTLDLQIVF